MITVTEQLEQVRGRLPFFFFLGWDIEVSLIRLVIVSRYLAAMFV